MKRTPPCQWSGIISREWQEAGAWWLATLAVGGVFLAAAAGKSLAPMRFEMVVSHVLKGLGLEVLPVEPIVLVLIGIEGLLGAACLLGTRSRAVHVVAISILAAFLGILCWMWAYPPAQGCGCIGFWTFPNDPKREIVTGVARNLGLIMCLIAIRRSAEVSVVGAQIRVDSHRPGTRGGFSLIEMIVVILVIAVVLAVALPALARAKRTGRRVVDLSEARQIFVAMSAYGQDYRERFPYCATPGKIDGPLTLMGGTVQYQTSYFFGQAQLYINLLVPSYLSVPPAMSANSSPASVVPGGLPDEAVSSLVWLSYTAFALPGYWDADDEPPSPAPLLTAARWSDIRFPSSKGLLLDIRVKQRQYAGDEPKEPGHLWGIVWGDGSTVRRLVDMEVTYDVVRRPATMHTWPILSTRGGLAGRDFEVP